MNTRKNRNAKNLICIRTVVRGVRNVNGTNECRGGGNSGSEPVPVVRCFTDVSIPMRSSPAGKGGLSRSEYACSSVERAKNTGVGSPVCRRDARRRKRPRKPVDDRRYRYRGNSHVRSSAGLRDGRGRSLTCKHGRPGTGCALSAAFRAKYGNAR